MRKWVYRIRFCEKRLINILDVQYRKRRTHFLKLKILPTYIFSGAQWEDLLWTVAYQKIKNHILKKDFFIDEIQQKM